MLPFPSPYNAVDKANLYPCLLVKNAGEKIVAFFPVLQSLNFSFD